MYQYQKNDEIFSTRWVIKFFTIRIRSYLLSCVYNIRYMALVAYMRHMIAVSRFRFFSFGFFVLFSIKSYRQLTMIQPYDSGSYSLRLIFSIHKRGWSLFNEKNNLCFFHGIMILILISVDNQWRFLHSSLLL